MFSEINGLPVHPLAIHAAVVMVPLAALLGVLFVIPLTRGWARVPFPLVAVGAAAAVFVARLSGEEFKEALGIGGDNEVAALVEKHEEAANLLLVAVLVFAALALIAFVLSRRADSFKGPVATIVSVLLVVGGGAVAFQTYRVGELGSKAVWNPTGDADFSSSGDESGEDG